MTRSTRKIGAIGRLHRPQVYIHRARLWRNWARSLAERSQRIGAVRIPAVMTLVDGRPRLVFIRNTFAPGRPNPANAYRFHVSAILQWTLQHHNSRRLEHRFLSLRKNCHATLSHIRPAPAERPAVVLQPIEQRGTDAALPLVLRPEPSKTGSGVDRNSRGEMPHTGLASGPRLSINTPRISSRSPALQPAALSLLRTLARDTRKARRRTAPSREAQTLYSRTLSPSVRHEQPIQSSLPLLVRRPAPVKDPLAASPLRADAQRRSSEESRLASKALAQPSPPLLDVSVVADQVMRELDRRVVAQRERMGRI